jgi:hypothetical protein
MLNNANDSQNHKTKAVALMADLSGILSMYLFQLESITTSQPLFTFDGQRFNSSTGLYALIRIVPR